MARALRIRNLGTVARFSEAVAKLQRAGDCVLLIRGVPRALVMTCPDGCGETLTVNLDSRVGPAWRRFERHGQVTVYPSVWRDNGCRAHFIVWKDHILWCGPTDEYSVNAPDERLLVEVYASLSQTAYEHYESLADRLDTIPWEVLWACRTLVRRGSAQQGEAGMFRATAYPSPSSNRGSLDHYA
jgi:hypothetical protein